MKRKLLLGLAATASFAVLAVTQLSIAADTKPAPGTLPTPEQAGSGPRHDKDRGGACGDHRFGGPRDKGGRGGPGEFRRGEGRPPMFGHDLNLTPDQKEKVKAIMEANKPKVKAIMDEQRTKMQAVMDEAQKELRPILTPAQQQVLDDTIKLSESQRKLHEDARAAKQEKSE